MNSLNLDFRGGYLRTLVMKDSSAGYTKLSANFPLSDIKAAKETLLSEIKSAGGRKRRINVILPSDIIKYKTLQIPSMDIQDAKKVIKRELTKELQGQKFTFGIRRLVRGREKTGGQEILAEYVLYPDFEKIRGLLGTCGLEPSVITTSLEGNVRLFNRIRPETEENEAVVEIGLNFMEIIVFNNRNLVNYKKIPMSTIDDEKSRVKDVPVEQIYKMKIYTIIDALYNFIMESRNADPEGKLSRLWIGGLGSMAENMTGYISDGLGIRTELLSPFDAPFENSSAFSALAGVSSIEKADQCVNLIPEDMLEARSKVFRQTLLAASLAFYVVFIISSLFLMNTMERDLKASFEKIKAFQVSREGREKVIDSYSIGSKTMSDLIAGSSNLYGIFRDIANLTPSGVTLDNMQAERKQEKNYLRISATIAYTDENLKKSLLTRFLSALDSSSRLRKISTPEITMSKTNAGKREISVKAAYEVLP